MNEDYKQVSWRNWQAFRPFLMGLLMVGLIASLAGCGGLPLGESEPPLHLPSVAPGSPCPVMTEQKVAPYFGLALGKGPIYPVAGWKHGVYAYHGAKQTNGWFYVKVSITSVWFYSVLLIFIAFYDRIYSSLSGLREAIRTSSVCQMRFVCCTKFFNTRGELSQLALVQTHERAHNTDFLQPSDVQ